MEVGITARASAAQAPTRVKTPQGPRREPTLLDTRRAATAGAAEADAGATGPSTMARRLVLMFWRPIRRRGVPCRSRRCRPWTAQAWLWRKGRLRRRRRRCTAPRSTKTPIIARCHTRKTPWRAVASAKATQARRPTVPIKRGGGCLKGGPSVDTTVAEPELVTLGRLTKRRLLGMARGSTSPQCQPASGSREGELTETSICNYRRLD